MDYNSWKVIVTTVKRALTRSELVEISITGGLRRVSIASNQINEVVIFRHLSHNNSFGVYEFVICPYYGPPYSIFTSLAEIETVNDEQIAN